MYVRLTNTIYFDSANQFFYCYIKIVARDAVTNTPVKGYTVAGTWGVVPDINWYTDWYSEMPYDVTGNMGGSAVGYTDSPWIPRAASLKSWYPSMFPSTYKGTRCQFTVTALTHPNYILDTSISTMTFQSALR